MPPTHSMTLVAQHERAKELKRIALTEKHCKDCKTFLHAWASLLDRAAQETDFGRAYDTVGRAADALESIISQEFAVTTSLDLEEELSEERERNSVERSLLKVNAESSNTDFLAHLGLVIRSFIDRVLLPFNAESLHIASLHGFSDDEFGEDVAAPSSRATVHLYLVRGHDDNEDIGPSDDDVNRMKLELERLSAPGFQSFSMVVHRLDIDHDPVLSAAFAFASHSMVIPTIVEGRQTGQIRHYINAKEFRQVLLSEHDRTHLAFSSSSGKPRAAHHVELPVFWFFGVDSSKEPLYVDGYHRAVHLKDLVVVVESKHASVERLDAWCGNQKVRVSVVRPLRAAILATAHLWWSENLGSEAAERYIEESVTDWSWASGVGDARGLSLFEERDESFGGELLSSVVVDAFHRSTISEALRKVNRLVEKAKTSHLDEDKPLLDKVLRLKSEVLKCSRYNRWKCAFEKLTACGKETLSLSAAVKKAAQKYGKSKTSRTCRRKHPKNGAWDWIKTLWR